MRSEPVGRKFRVFDRVVLRDAACVGGRLVRAPVGLVVAVNEYGLHCVRLEDGSRHWYRAEELERLPEDR